MPEGKFGDARRRIAGKYDEVERSLIEEFHSAHQRDDVASMKQLAHLLVHFKGYSQCIDAFIEFSQSVSIAVKNDSYVSSTIKTYDSSETIVFCK